MHNINTILNKMSPFVRRALDDTMPLNWILPNRVIFDNEILYIKEGHAIINIDNTSYDAKPGDLFFFRPNIPHCIKAVGNIRLRQPHIHFDFFYQSDSDKVYIPLSTILDPLHDMTLMRKDITSYGSLYIPDKIELPTNSIVDKLMFRIISEHNSLSPMSILRKKALLFELIAFLLEYTHPSKEPSRGFQINSATLYHINELIENQCNQNLSLEKLSNEVGYSKNHFVQLYKAQFGITPGRYHEKIRLDKAISYLSQKNITITEIAYSLGFDSLHNFSRYFKRLMGISPQKHRQQLPDKI